MADVFDNWATQVRKGLLELCVLLAIAGGRRYGYDLVRQLGELPGLGLSDGTVYPLLSRLRKDGLVEAVLEESDAGPARKYYQLTGRGRRHLAQMRAHWRELSLAIETLGGNRSR